MARRLRNKASLPAKVLEVARDMLKAKWDEARAGAVSASSVTVGATSLVLKPGWPFHVTQAIDRLRYEYRVGLA